MESNKKKMKDRITDTVFDFMETTEIPHITVEAVICKAGIARSSFYRYFSSIDDVVKEVENEFFDEMVKINDLALTVHGTNISPLTSESMLRRMDSFHKNSHKILLIIGPNGDPSFLNRMTIIMAKYFRKKLANIMNADDINMEFYIKFMTAGHHSVIQYWLLEHPEITPLQIASMLNKLFYSILQDGKLPIQK